MVGKPYRVCVVGVFIDKNGLILVAERADSPGSWQLPQGGVEENEIFESALRREMFEELGVKKITILKRVEEPIYYEFPNNLKAPIAARYRGQEMNWFLLELGGDEQPDFEIATDDEFSNFKWVPPNVVIELIAPWKTEAYKTGFKSMGLI